MTIGRIYKIVTGQSNQCYIGSTINELRYRFRQHKGAYKQWKNGKKIKPCSSFDLFEKYGLEQCQILLVKEYEIFDKKHLRIYEQLWLSKLRPVNVNKVNSFWIKYIYDRVKYQKTLQNNPNHNKDKYQKALKNNPTHNKDKYQKQLQQNPNHNKEHYQKLVERKPNLGKERYQKRLEKNPNYNKERYQKDKEKNSEKISCDCGKIVSRKCLSDHKKTKKHQQLMEQQT